MALLVALSLLQHALREGFCLPALRLLEGDVASTLLFGPLDLGGDRLVPLTRGVALSNGRASADSKDDSSRCGDRCFARHLHTRHIGPSGESWQERWWHWAL